jgi:S-adenosylmethionine:tRNA ribosyltransferase-isomerase
MNSTLENELLYIDSFDYPLPEDRIAKFPLEKRDSSKLLVYKSDCITESNFSNIADYIPENALLVYNNTRVIQARLIFRKSSGARIEVFCLEPLVPSDYSTSLSATGHCNWTCMVGNLKKWKEGAISKELCIAGKPIFFTAEHIESKGNMHNILFSWNDQTVHFAEILENAGELPIPPYLNRKTEESDLVAYQTVYSKISGSVAAPTAGLHFTDEVFETLKSKRIEIDELTLHVGAGTFQPVKTVTVNDHEMHTEVIYVQKTTIEHLLQKSGNIIAVGTTSVRTLESLYYIGLLLKKQLLTQQVGECLQISQWLPYQIEASLSSKEALQAILDYLNAKKLSALHAETQILIKPGYDFHLVDGMITNFHQPKSTLLLLVSAFVKGNWKEIYEYAMANNFRFLSYGDSSLLLK